VDNEAKTVPSLHITCHKIICQSKIFQQKMGRYGSWLVVRKHRVANKSATSVEPAYHYWQICGFWTRQEIKQILKKFLHRST